MLMQVLLLSIDYQGCIQIYTKYTNVFWLKDKKSSLNISTCFSASTNWIIIRQRRMKSQEILYSKSNKKFCVYIYLYVHIDTYIYTYTSPIYIYNMHIYICTHIYTNIHTFTYIHRHTHTHHKCMHSHIYKYT